MTDNSIVERVDLQKKDKSELQTIVAALGGKASSRATKSDLIDSILDLSGAGDDAPASPSEPTEAVADDTPAEGDPSEGDNRSEDEAGSDDAESPAEPEAAKPKNDDSAGKGKQGAGRRRRRGNNEPPAEWETELASEDKPKSSGGNNTGNGGNDNAGNKNNAGNGPAEGNEQKGDEPDSANRRRRRRGRGRDRDDEQLPALEPIVVSGYLDLRDDGYGFLRVSGYLQSAEDVYVPVKMARQFGLRKGDLVEGTARPANRNEKNPALQTITSVNGADPETSRSRPRFEDLTAVYPFERLPLEQEDNPLASGARLMDLVAPIGKGQRGLIVAPPEAGASELIKQVASAIESNNPEVHLMVLQFDGRPEEIVDIESALDRAEVGAATFDAPPEDQCALADFTIERAKRLAETGDDVVIIADGLTTIARAYSLGTQPTGRTITGVDASALHPTKRFFGAARKLEEAGSLTILATITVGTGSVFDEALFAEFRGTATSEVHLDAWLADEGVFPNIDVELSTTRSADLLVDPDDLAAIDTLRSLMASAVDEADGPAVDAARRLVDRLEAAKTNASFLEEISGASAL